MNNYIKQIGTKVYYCNITGNVLKVIGDMQGYVKETKFDEDYVIYQELGERSKDTIGFIYYPYGEFSQVTKGSTGYSVDLETKKLVLTFEQLPEIPPEPDKVDLLEGKISILNEQNSKLLLDKAKNEIQINTLNKNLANVTLEVAKMKGGM